MAAHLEASATATLPKYAAIPSSRQGITQLAI